MHAGDHQSERTNLAGTKPLLERFFAAMLDQAGEISTEACTSNLDQLKQAAVELASACAQTESLRDSAELMATVFDGLDQMQEELVRCLAATAEAMYESVHAAESSGSPIAEVPADILGELRALQPQGGAEHQPDHAPEREPENQSSAEVAPDAMGTVPAIEDEFPIQAAEDDLLAATDDPTDEVIDQATDQATNQSTSDDFDQPALDAPTEIDPDDGDAEAASATSDDAEVPVDDAIAADVPTDGASEHPAPAEEAIVYDLDVLDTLEHIAADEPADADVAAEPTGTDEQDSQEAPAEAEHELIEEVGDSAAAEAIEAPGSEANEAAAGQETATEFAAPTVHSDAVDEPCEAGNDPTIAGSAGEAWDSLDAMPAEPNIEPNIEANAESDHHAETASDADNETAATAEPQNENDDSTESEENTDAGAPAVDALEAPTEAATADADGVEHDPFATMPDPNAPLDPTGGGDPFAAMPDPNAPLDPTGGGDPFATMPDPNAPLDPTGGGDPFATMPDPNAPLDPTGGGDPFATMPDPNAPLDPTGGGDPFAAMPDPNAPLDPTGGGGPSVLTPEQMAELMAADSGGGDDDDVWGTTPLMLTADKAELLQFMVSDIREAVGKLEGTIGELRDVTMRADCSQTMVDIAEEMAKVSSFFEFKSLTRLVEILRDIGGRISELPDAFIGELEIRVRAIASLISQHCGALEVAMEQCWPLSTFARRIDLLLSGTPLHADLIGWHNGDVERLLELDQIVEGIEQPPMPETDEGDAAAMTAMADSAAANKPQDATGETAQPTIRVPKDRIEHLLDVVRQLVLSKNQMGRLARSLRHAHSTPDAQTGAERVEQLNARAEQLDRLIGDLQLSLMDTRMQSIDKLLTRYDRVIRDIARLNDKEVEMDVVGAHTKVDKFVLEALSDPLGRILRHLASDDVETTEERTSLGKPATARIGINAENQGSHIRITLTSDGKGLDAGDVRTRAATWQLMTNAELEALDDDALFTLLLDSRFEDSPLAGLHGVLTELDAETTLSSTPGRGMSIDITLPVTSAVIPAMLVGLGKEVYAIPLQSVHEIVKAGDEIRHEVNGTPCVRIRGDVLASINLGSLLHIDSAEPGGKLAVVVAVGDERVALMVDRILGHQEIVIESLDAGSAEAAGPFSGATIRDDGGVSLIFDLGKLFRHAKSQVSAVRHAIESEGNETIDEATGTSAAA